MRMTMRAGVALVLLLWALPGRGQHLTGVGGSADGGWAHYGADPGGSRFSVLDQIHRDNVDTLEVAWTYRSGNFSDGSGDMRESKFEATPILFSGKLVFSTPFSRIVALDPDTGRELWTYDPGIDLFESYSESLVSRGVAAWDGPDTDAASACAKRILFATLDARLVAVDAEDGRSCQGFGDGGQVELKVGVGEVEIGEYEVTSPPAVVGDVVVVGSAMGDNRRVQVERGTVRGFDVRTGALLWSFDPIPRTPDAPGWNTWSPEGASITGAANAWSVMSADPERDLVFVPTGSAAPDFYGGIRVGNNLFGNSVLALRASTGELVWHFQVVHHDLWDYDVASQPVLTTVQRDGVDVPSVVINTKMGHVFVLHRETGEPLFPIEERRVPASDVPGEVTSETQPFPVLPPALHPATLTPADFEYLPEPDRISCTGQLSELRHDGLFTPPSLEGTLVYPGFGGGVNWGSAAVDPTRTLMIANVLNLPFWVRLVPREEFRSRAQASRRAGLGVQFTAQEGTPYGMSRSILQSASGRPCLLSGRTVAVDLNAGTILWETPAASGMLGGAIATAGGLVFVTGAQDRMLRALDIETGSELWRHPLPAASQSTPMTYRSESTGKQYVIAGAGDPGSDENPVGDALVAFALP